MIRTTLSAVAMAAALFATPAFSAEPIEGTWKRVNGTMIAFSGSGNRFCGKVLNGKYKGQSIGCMSGSGNNYKGKINVLDEGKTYTGKAAVSGSTMKLSGCVLGGIICKGENLRRQ